MADVTSASSAPRRRFLRKASSTEEPVGDSSQVVVSSVDDGTSAGTTANGEQMTVYGNDYPTLEHQTMGIFIRDHAVVSFVKKNLEPKDYGKEDAKPQFIKIKRDWLEIIKQDTQEARAEHFVKHIHCITHFEEIWWKEDWFKDITTKMRNLPQDKRPINFQFAYDAAHSA